MLAPGLRCLVVGLHLIFYTVDSNQITVVRVIDGRMDVDEEFHR
jgi:plasmid stabilization system protein ParE